MIYKKDGVEFKGDITIGEVVYPPNWWGDAAQCVKHGVTVEADPPPPPPAPPTAEELAAWKEQNLTRLWQAAHDYEASQIAGAGIGILTLGVIAKNANALAMQGWVAGLWALYDQRALLITSEMDMFSPLFDFSIHGDKPYSISALAADLRLK